MQRVAFTTLGCKVNQYETHSLEGLFQERGYEVVDFQQPAEVYVINTCSVTHLGERKSRQTIRRATRINPGALVVVTGCYAQLSPEEVTAIPGVDLVVGTQQRHEMVNIVEAARKGVSQTSVTDIMVASVFEDIPLFTAPGQTRAFLKIQEGCNNYCSYCIVPYARGGLRSRPLASIVQETKKLVAAGFQEVVLTGIHLGAYGRDLAEGISFMEAICQVRALAGHMRLRLSSLEFSEVSPELIQLMQQDKWICPHLHLPLQAGDDKILQAMNRHYTTAQYRQLIGEIFAKVPDIAISTDIIVGFPGETEAQFANMLALVESLELARIHVFPYSPRRGTPAASFPDQVVERVKKSRVGQLQKLAEKKAVDFHAKFIGRELEVLLESVEDGIASGLTPNYIRVYLPTGDALRGQLKMVQLQKVFQDGLWGEIIC